jgi:hypothetical protein
MKNKEAISNLLYETLDSPYCDNCRFSIDDPFEYCCDCHRKYINWAVARHTCDELAETIILMEEKEND